MYVSRLNIFGSPGHSHDIEQQFEELRDLVLTAGGQRPRLLRTHYASLGAPDLVFEQEAESLAALEAQIAAVTEKPEFQAWTAKVSSLLTQPPKREIYVIVDSADS